MSTEPLDARAVLSQWLQRLRQHTHAAADAPYAPDSVRLSEFPLPYFQTQFNLVESYTAEQETEAEDEDEAVAMDAVHMADVKHPGDVPDAIEHVAGVYKACRSTVHEYEVLPSGFDQVSTLVKIYVYATSVATTLPPAALCVRRNGDVELAYYIPTRSSNVQRVTIYGTGIDAVVGMFLRMYAACVQSRLAPTVVAAAVRVKHCTYAVPIPKRHNHAIAAAARAGHASPKNPITQEMQGFLLSDGDFVNRKTALAAAVLSGQLAYDPDRVELFSEDLW